MKKSRITALFMAAALAISANPSMKAIASSTPKATTAPKAKTKFTVTFLKNDWHGNPNNMDVFKKMNEKANVEIEWQIYDNATWPDKKNLVIASGDLPNVFYMNALNATDVAKYASQGMLVDLTDLIPKYAPRLNDVFKEMPNYKSICVDPDTGKIFSIGRAAERPVQYTQALQYINKKWLDKLGLDVPKTTDDLYKVLKAFKEKDPNGNGKADEIPYSFSTKDDFSYTDLFGSFGYTDTVNHFIKDEKGKIVYVANKPEYRDAIKFFSKFVQEGLWDKEGFTTADTKMLTAKGNNPDNILGAFAAFDSSFVLPKEKLDDYVILPPLAGPNGKIVARYHGASNGNINGTQFVVSQSAKGKEAAIMGWLNEHFDPTTSVELFLGAVDVCLTKTSSGMLDYIPTPQGKSYSEFRYANSPVHVPCLIRSSDWGKVVAVMDEDKNKMQIAKQYYEQYQTQSSLFLRPNASESKFILSTGKDIDDYVTKVKVKWLTEGGIDAEWDNYVKELDKLGLAKYQETIENIVTRMAK